MQIISELLDPDPQHCLYCSSLPSYFFVTIFCLTGEQGTRGGEEERAGGIREEDRLPHLPGPGHGGTHG